MRFALLLALLAASPAFAAPPPPITALAYSADGKTLAAGGRGSVTLVNPADGVVTATHAGLTGRVTALAFNAAGTLAAASGEAGRSGVVTLYPAGSAGPTATIPAHADTVYAVAWSPDGATLATAGYDRAVKLWAVSAGAPPRLVRTLADHSDAVYAVAFHPAGGLLATGSADRAVKVWDAATGKRLYTLSDPTDWVYAVAWTPDGKRLAAAGADRSLRVWAADRAGGKLLASVVAHEKPVTRLFAGAGTFVTVGEDRVVKVWDAAKLGERAVSPARPEAVLSAALSSDGKQLAVGRFDGVVELLDAATGKVQSAPLPAKPTLTGVTPAGVVRGKPTVVTLAGTDLGRLTAVRSPTPGVTAVLGAAGAVTVTAAGPVGPADLVGVYSGGETAPVRVWVDWFPAVPESPTVNLPATVAGALDHSGAVDEFAVALKAGEELGLHVVTPLGTDKFAPVLGVTDPSGRSIGSAKGPRLGVTAAAAGTHTVSVRDRLYRGGKGFAYRLHAGPVPVVSSVRPLAVARGTTAEVAVTGVHLGGVNRARVAVPADAAAGAKVPVRLPAADAAGAVTVLAEAFPTVPVAAGAATLPGVPATADGVLDAPGAAHRVTFKAKRGEPVVVEVEADRLGSPVDSTVTVTDPAGTPVPRAVLRGVARAFTTFRDHDAASPNMRLEAWNELAVDDYLYAAGELMRVREMPPTPDDDCRFYAANGRRAAFLGTAPTAHATGTPLYKVELHPPGATFPPNGMPVFAVPYRNDDGAGRDAKLTFDPPADGDYVAVVTDAAGAGGPGHGYRLTVRPPRPGFTLTVSPRDPGVWAGGGVPVTVTAARQDDFAGPIDVAFEGLPAGFAAPPTRIEAGHHTAVVPLTAAADAAPGAAPARVVGRATVAGTPVTRTADLGTPKPRAGAYLALATSVREVAVRPGATATMAVSAGRSGGFDGRVPVEVRGLPHGVVVLDVGLNGVLITPDKTAREFVIRADPWVKPGRYPFTVQATTVQHRNAGAGAAVYAAPPVVLVVE